MEAFLRFADQSWGKAYNLAWALGMFLLPIVVLVLLWDDRGSTSFVLTGIGLVIVVVAVKTRHYKVMLAWGPDAMPPTWEAGRDKYFAINWIQMAVTWSAFALFIAALIALEDHVRRAGLRTGVPERAPTGSSTGSSTGGAGIT